MELSIQHGGRAECRYNGALIWQVLKKPSPRGDCLGLHAFCLSQTYTITPENQAITLLVAKTTQNLRALPFVPGIFHCNGATYIPVVSPLAIPEYADPHGV
jgi:hypothetical protein